jgi:hypothetical protein
MSPRLALCLLLCGLSFPLMAHEISRAGANGDGGSVDAEVCNDDVANVARKPVGKSTAAPKPSVKAKTATARGGGIGDQRPPRWHSFLPGMFR